MEFVIVWSLGGILLCVIFYIITRVHQKYVKRHEEMWDPRKQAEQRRLNESRRREFRELVKYNLDNLPSGEPPKLAPDWAAVNRLINLTGFYIQDNGDTYSYGGDMNYWDIHYISKSEFDGDTLCLIGLLDNDLKWFIANPTGLTVSEEQEVFENFLKEKYSGLSEKSVKALCFIQLYYDR